MGSGVSILETVTRECEVEQISKFSFRIVLTQGLNRQIRRMCEHLGYDVLKLKRTRIMNVKLDMPIGEWRYISPEELSEIYQLVQSSAKTHEVLHDPDNLLDEEE
jgi:23S rRNA pseudouridine2604 synthase